MTNRDAVALGARLLRIEQFRQFGQLEQTAETRLRDWSVNADWYSAELLRRESITRIIEEADRLASQAGRETCPAEENQQGPNLGRLEFITRRLAVTDEGLRYRESSQSLKYYPISPLSVSDVVFRQREAPPSTNENAPLWEQFAAKCKLLPTGSFAVYFDSLLHLLHKFAWCIPNAPGGVVSLYDHARSAAALAISLYDTLQEDAGDDRPFLLIEGDVSGVQQFIYNPAFNGQELQDRIARRLRGRSFYLNLLLKTIADWLIEELGLYSVNILWASGGHFLIVAPNTEKTRGKLKDSVRKTQRWTWREFRGALGLVIADLHLTREELSRFGEARERLAQITARLKHQQIAAPLSFGSGSPSNEWSNSWVLNMGREICRDTGRDLSQEESEISDKAQREEETQLPRSPQSLFFDAIGRALVNARTIQLRRRDGWPEKEDIARLPRDEADAGKLKEAARGALIEFLDLNRTWLLSEEVEPLDSADLCLRLADHRDRALDFLSDVQHPSVAQGFVFMATAVKTEKEEGRDVIVDFHELAVRATGVNFLGALRMDVDNLGYIFAHGLPKSEGSIAKIANLSRMFDWFFAGYINTLVAGRNLYTTYAGGDDLFIIGAWNEVLDLADKIQREFKSFCGDNPDLSISAGIALRKGKYPIGRAAEEAGDKLDQVAKAQKSAWLDGDSDKNALAFLERKISWEKWTEARAVGERIIEAERVLSAGVASRGGEVKGKDGIRAEFKDYWTFCEAIDEKMSFNGWLDFYDKLLADEQARRVMGWNESQRSLTPSQLCRAVNHFAADLCQWEIEYFRQIVAGPEGRCRVEQSLHFYEDLKADVEEAGADTCYFSVGHGSGWHKLTVGLLLEKHLDRQSFARLRQRLRLADRHTDFEYPKSRKLVMNGERSAYSPFGWVKMNLVPRRD